jgi:hypothetical protein
MANKKAKKKATKKKAVRKKARGKLAGKLKSPAAKRTSPGRASRVSGASARKQAAVKKRVGAKSAATDTGLGRPRISGDEKLYLLFKEDYHAREVFAYLRVETVKELEQHSAKEILKQLTAPVVGTVNRIREKLAGYNRCLLDDEEFARQANAEK